MPFYIPRDQQKHKIPISLHNMKLYCLTLAESERNWDKDSIIKLLVLTVLSLEAKFTT